MKRINRLQAWACGIALLALTACTDVWEEHYQPSLELNGDENLWELISGDPDLQGFAAFLSATGYDTLLTKNRNYTVWAPMAGCDMALLDGATDSLLAVYRKEIVENHIANYTHVAGGFKDKEDTDKYQKVLMLNGKAYHFEGSVDKGYTLSNSTLKRTNIVAKNGVLHKVDGAVTFGTNIWDQLSREENLSSLWKHMSKYYVRTYDEYNSVKGPIVDGKETILDSAWIESCRWFAEIGHLNVDDSSYTMYALSNKAWDEMYTNTRSYFNYSSDLETDDGRDSETICDSVVKELMCRHMVFSNTINEDFYAGLHDTLISNYYGYPRQEFIGQYAHALKNGAIGEPKKLSNGLLYIVDQSNYEPLTLWHDTIRIQGERLSSEERYPDNDKYNNVDRCGYGLVITVNESGTTKYELDELNKSIFTVTKENALYEKISGGKVGVFEVTEENEKNSLNPVFNFYVEDILSAKYRVEIVLLPADVVDPLATFIKPNKFKAKFYVNGVKEILMQPVEERSALNEKGQVWFVSDPTKIDTILLAECLDVPTCEAFLNSINSKEEISARLKIESDVTYGRGMNNNGSDKSKWKYDKNFRIDEVIFTPLPDDYVSKY